MATSVINLVPGINIQAPKVNFGAKDAWGEVARNAAATVGNWNQLGSDYDGLADDAIARKHNKSTRIDDMSKLYGSQIDEQHKLSAEFEKLKAEADAELAKMPKDSKGSGDAKKAAAKLAKESREIVGYISEVVSNLKKAYDDKVQEIKNLVESEEYTPTQGFLAQIEAIKSYSSKAEAEVRKALNRQGLTMKMRESLNGKLLDLDRNMLNETKKLQTEMSKERKEYLQSITDIEVEFGVKRLTALDTFEKNYAEKIDKLVKRAKKENDTATLSRLQTLSTAAVYKSAMVQNDNVGYNEFDVARDKKNNLGDLYKFDTGVQVKAIVGEYEELFKKIQPLMKQGTINETEATNIHNSLMAARTQATREAAIAARQARQDIGISTNEDSLILFLDKIRDGFVDLRTEAINMAIEIGKALTDNISSNLTDVITGAKTLKQAFADIASTIFESVIQAIIQMGVKWAATTMMNSMLGKAAAAESTATAATSGAAITTAMAPAAATTSLATMGSNTITASTGMLAFGAVMTMMLGSLLAGAFDNGGYIPDGKLGIVGEYGPEIIQGPVAVTGRKTTESIISSATSKGGSAGGGNVVSIQVDVHVTDSGSSTNVSSPGNISEKEFKAMGDQMARIAEKVLLKNIKQGGLLDGPKR